MKRALNVTLTLAALSTVGVLAAQASKTAENDALAIRHADITLTQAVQAAEQQLHGKAVRAEFEHGKAGWVFEVEVVANNKTYDVTVDPAKGTVLTTQEDKGDHDHGEEQED
ncbi:MAG: peptidase M4 [Geobacter sp.]|nr:peptidase M4 [Geobacter sp.]